MLKRSLNLVKVIPQAATTRPFPTRPLHHSTSLQKSPFHPANKAQSTMSISPPPPLHTTLKPPRHPDMRTLDREAFTLRHPLLSVRLDAGKIAKIRGHPVMRGWLMDMSKARLVLDDPEGGSSTKLIRLKVNSQDELPAPVRELLEKEGRGFVQDTLELKYDHWTTSDILNAILPNTGEGDPPSAFTQTGHIGHVNLKDEWLPYKSLIGQVFLDKNTNLRTIVNKLDSIHAEFRYFDMEVLAGDHDFITTCHESGCTFTFDFSKVYWNSRLQGEHDRLISLLQPGHVVVDVMAGVGPFAVPAAKKGCFVLGNDLNPESVKWMRENQQKNKVQSTLRVTEMDGKEFIQKSASSSWFNPFPPFISPAEKKKREQESRKKRESQNPPPVSHPVPSAPVVQPQLPRHFIMNLPDSALTFLGAFRGLFTPLKDQDGFQEILQQTQLPLVHVYCFTRFLDFEEAQNDISERASHYLGHPVSSSMDGYHLHLVRRVAPNKDMYCLTFRLPEEVAFAPVEEKS